MKSLLLFALLFPVSLAVAQGIPAGSLGYPLGAYLRIEGIRAEKGLVGVNTLIVDTVNGKKLKSPVGIWIENVPSLPENTRCILRGYETGRMIGVPLAVEQAALEESRQIDLPQRGWGFERYFIILSVVEPKDLEKN